MQQAQVARHVLQNPNPSDAGFSTNAPLQDLLPVHVCKTDHLRIAMPSSSCIDKNLHSFFRIYQEKEHNAEVSMYYLIRSSP
jgi:broad specificity polyphosphatase/5'/3'-nucleotidase SurE